MNTKNLWLKLACVGLFVTLCVLSLQFRGLKWGIDIQGGSSLIYEIRPDQARIARLEAKQLELQQELTDQELDAKQRKKIEAQLKNVSEDLKASLNETESGNLVNQMITLLKKRVDPEGLRSIEWRPLGRDRFEVRMPAGKAETRQLRKDYFDALETLENNNIQRSEIRSILQALADQREAQIKLFVKDDKKQAGELKLLAASNDVLQTAQAAKDAAKAALVTAMKAKAADDKLDKLNVDIKTAQASLDKALADYTEKRQVVLAGNVSREALHRTLEGYYLTTLQAGGKTEKKTKPRKMAQELVTKTLASEGGSTVTADIEKFKAEHPTRSAEIDDIMARFEAWSKVRERLDDPSDLKRLIAKSGVLEFRVAPAEPGSKGVAAVISETQLKEYERMLESPEEREAMRKRNEEMLWFPVHGKENEYILLYNRDKYTMLHEHRKDWALEKASPDRDEYGKPAIQFELNDAGASRMATLTFDNQTNFLAILLDGEVYSAPQIREDTIISHKGVISGTFTQAEVSDLIDTLNSGSLPGKLSEEPVSESMFGPAIGAVNRDMGKNAAIWAMIAVAIFMLFYYLLPGLIADIALLLNIVLVLGTMSIIGAVFTLPGIAGIILTIGIAVDANVLIFERLREEQAKGQTVRQAIKNAYERAFSAIFDANITTMLVCIILGWVGTEEVRGFAITLGFGVAFSLFSALVFTRWLFQILLDIKVISKPIVMLKVIGVPKVNWMAKRHFFWVLTILFVALGIGSLSMQGRDIWGIEFSSGTKAVISMKPDALIGDDLPNDSIVRDMFKAKAAQMPDASAEDPNFDYAKLEATAIVETHINPNRVSDFLRDYDSAENPDGQITSDEWAGTKLSPAFFAKIDSNADGTVTIDELDENLPETSYQISTTETKVAKIRRVAEAAFGDSLRIRQTRSASVIEGGNVAALGLDIPATGWVEITAQTRARMTAEYRDILLDYDTAMLRVLRAVSPAISKTELTQRIREMRLQPDYADHMLTRTLVMGLGTAEDDKFTEFAIILIPDEDVVSQTPEARTKWLAGEASLLNEALAREQAMVATNFDAAIAEETAQRAIVAVVLSWLAIVIYLWLRFGSVQWGLAAVICLIHDVVIVVGLVAASGWVYNTVIGKALGIQSFKIDLAMVAAILTVIGYSVNDTIVIFDRIRENRGKLTTVSVPVINSSINQTLARTLLTSGTTFIVVIIMYVAGGPGIHAFNYALLAGILFGTYSSVAVASPLLMGFKQALVAKVTGDAASQ